MAKPKFGKKINDRTDAGLQPINEASATSVQASSVEAVESPAEMRKTESRRTSRKQGTRTEPRPNLVPINLEDEIRNLAYLLSERRGFTPGHETEDWLTAEHEVLQRYHQQGA